HGYRTAVFGSFPTLCLSRPIFLSCESQNLSSQPRRNEKVQFSCQLIHEGTNSSNEFALLGQEKYAEYAHRQNSELFDSVSTLSLVNKHDGSLNLQGQGDSFRLANVESSQ